MIINKEKNILEFHDIYDFLLNSWIYGFRSLENFIKLYCSEEFSKLNIYFPNKQQMDYAIMKHQDNLKQFLIQTFSELNVDIRNEPISFETFKNWLQSDRTLEITFYNKTLRFAVSLTCLVDVGIKMDG